MKLATVCRVLFLALVLLVNGTCPVRASDDDVMSALDKELERSFPKLKNAGEAPVYYIGYRLYDLNSVYITAEYGALNGSVEPSHSRVLNVDLRVGSHKVDNTHKVRSTGFFNFSRSSAGSTVYVPLEDNEMALRHAIWLQTDQAFQKGQEQFAKVQANKEVNVDEEDRSDDFSLESSQTHTEDIKELNVDLDKWTKETKRLSAIFKEYPQVYDSQVTFSATRAKRYLVNTEGTKIKDSRTDYRIYTTAQARAEDGMDLWLYDDANAIVIDELPDSQALEKLVRGVAEKLVKLSKAPKAEPYAGPAILNQRAAGVFMHEVFGHRMEGHRQKDEKEGRTFTKQIGQRVMPTFISIIDDPTIDLMGGLHLNGYYKYDDEGVPAQKVSLVDKGVLRSFLLARSPVKGFDKSNGHGRCSPEQDPVARMGNLLLQSDRTVPYEQLRKMLIDSIKKQGKPYGLVFDDISGGFTITSTEMPQLYSLKPLVVYKVYADGRPDELVRGVKIVGTPLTALEQIVCTSDETGTFNGVCGAESGNVPVSASSPAILVGTLEVELTDKRQDKPPLLKPPYHEKKSVGSDKSGEKAK